MTWWNDLMTWADGSTTRSAIVAGIIAGVVLIAIAGVISRIPKLRGPIFGWIAKLARRVPLRVTTPKRQAAALAAEYERGAGEARHTAFEEGLAVAGRNVTERMTREREGALEAQEARHQAEIEQSFTEGKAARQSELDAARTVVQQPQWRPEVFLDDNTKEYWITVHRAEGTGPATEVTIDADPRYFRFTFAPMFSGSSFANYRGTPTAAGLAEGVNFQLTWTDSAGDRQTRSLHVDASEFLPRVRSEDLVTRDLLDEAVLAAREEGRQAGLAKVGVAPPLPLPRWVVYHDDYQPGSYVLRNLVEESVALRVRLESEGNFWFQDGASFADLSGKSGASFRGMVTQRGRQMGAVMQISWYNEAGLLHSEMIMPSQDPDEDPF